MEENLPINTPQNLPAGEAGQKKGSAVFDFIKFIFIVAIIVIPVRFLVAQPFLVSGASMEPTYHDGDYLIVDEISYRVSDPKKDDVII